MDLSGHLREVDALPANRRGGAFEELIADALRAAQFRVTHDPGAARPRQSDLMAVMGRDRYLIECKHQTRPADIDDLDGLMSRLRRVEASVVGVLISRSGFTSTVTDEVRSRRERPVLLLDGPAVEELARVPERLADELERRRDALITHGGRGSGQDRLLDAVASVDEEPNVELVDMHGEALGWSTAVGSYEAPVQVLQLHDVDWTLTAGVGVTLDASVPCHDQADLIRKLDVLIDAGWVSHAGAWTIEQSERLWHGLGASSLVDALTASQERLEGLRYVHHREIVSYADQHGACAWTLQADVQSRERGVWHMELSLALPGVPLDVDPLRVMLRSIGVRADGLHFRPRAGAAVQRWTAGTPRRAPRLQVLGYAVERDDDELIVRGLVARNPFAGSVPKGLTEELELTDTLLLNLRSWHGWSERPAGYRLLRVEWMRSTDTVVSCATADWDGPLQGQATAPGASSADRPPRSSTDADQPARAATGPALAGR